MFFNFCYVSFLYPSDFKIEIKNEKFQKFLQADIKEARYILKQFTFKEIEDIWGQYNAKKSLKERRLLWLIEEYHLRKSDEIASTRLLYVFLAVFLFLLIIIIFLYSIIREQKKMLSRLN